MTLGAPAMLWWLMLMLPLAGMFFFRRRRTVVEFPAIVFWLDEHSAHSASRLGPRFSRLLTLLAQLLIIACLVAALTDPNPAQTSSHLIIVLDDSATMQTREPSDESRFDLAKTIARRRVRAEQPDVSVSIILAGESPRLGIDRETDHALVDSYIAALVPADVSAQLDRSVRRAQFTKDADPAVRIIVLTDQPAPPSSQSAGIEWVQLGTRQPNVSIASLSMSDDRDAVIVVLAQAGFSNSTVTVRLISDGHEVSRSEVTLREAPVDVELPAALPEGTPFRIEVEPGDALALDNVAYGVWPKGRRLRVRIASDDNIPLRSVLSLPGIAVELVAADEWDRAGDPDVTVIDSATRVKPDARGRFLVFGGVDPFKRTGTARIQTDLRPTQWRPDSNVLAQVNLLSWRIKRTAGFTSTAQVTPLVESGDVPLVMALSDASESGHPDENLAVLYVNFDLRDSNLLSPSNMSFPLFVLNAVDYLVGEPSAGTSTAHVTGRPHLLAGRVSDGVTVLQPEDRPHPVYVAGDQLMMAAPTQAGFYQVADGVGEEWLAFNWFPTATLAVQADALPTTAHTSSEWKLPIPKRPWRSLLVIGGLLIALEFALFHRHVLRMS